MGRFFIYILTGIILICSCNNKERKQTDENTISNSITTLHTDSVQGTDTLAKVQIEDPHFNFGDDSERKKLSRTLLRSKTRVRRTCSSPIRKADCGCTIPKYDKKPIPPGGEGKIEVEFNSSGRMGKQYKVIHIFAKHSGKKFYFKNNGKY